MEDKNGKEITLAFLKELSHKPLNIEFDGERADAVNSVIAYLEERVEEKN